MKSTFLLIFIIFFTLFSSKALAWATINCNSRMNLTFKNSASSESLINFPVMVELNSTRVNYTLTNSTDIRFYDSDDTTLLNHHVELWNSSGNSFLWVKVPQIDNTSTDYIYAYYNCSDSAVQNETGTYDSYFRMVQHLKEPSGTHYDSTGRGNNGTTSGTMYQNITGKVDGADNFTNGYVSLGSGSDFDLSGQVTYDMWVWVQSPVTGNSYHCFMGQNYAQVLWFGMYATTQKMQIWLDGVCYGACAAGTWPDITLDTWHHVAVTAATGTSNTKMWIDGQQYGPSITVSTDLIASSTDNMQIGKDVTGYQFQGKIDEVRVSNISRSASWINATYLTENDSFITYSSSSEQLVLVPTLSVLISTNETTPKIYNALNISSNVSCTILQCNNTNATISLPNIFTLVQGETETKDLGNLSIGETKSVSWIVNTTSLGSSIINVTARALNAIDKTVSTSTINVIEATPPTYTNFGESNSTPLSGDNVTFYSQWSDDTNLSTFIFSWTGGGSCKNTTWVNDTSQSFSAGNWTNTTKAISFLCSGKQISYKFYATDIYGNSNLTTARTIIPSGVVVWWNSSWHYRIPVVITSKSYDRYNLTVEHNINFTQILKDDINVSGNTFDVNSTRVVEYYVNGSIKNSNYNNTFVQASGFNATTNANGTLKWYVKDTSPANQTLYFNIYFDTTNNGLKEVPYDATIPDGHLVQYDSGTVDLGATYSLNQYTVRTWFNLSNTVYAPGGREYSRYKVSIGAARDDTGCSGDLYYRIGNSSTYSTRKYVDDCNTIQNKSQVPAGATNFKMYNDTIDNPNYGTYFYVQQLLHNGTGTVYLMMDEYGPTGPNPQYGSGTNDPTWVADNGDYMHRLYLVDVAETNQGTGETNNPPLYSSNSTNSSTAGTAVMHSLKWDDNNGMSYAILSFDNCTGTLQNVTNMTLSGTSTWNNFTVITNSTAGCTIRWCVYANDTLNNWNGTSCQNPFTYNTISAVQNYSTNITQAIYISHSTSRIYSSLSTISSYFTYTTVTTRLSILYKSISSYFSFYQSASILEAIYKIVTSSFTISQLSSRLSFIYRSITSSFILNQSVYRISTIYKSLTSSFTITQSNSRLLSSLRSIASYFTISQSVSRISSLFRSLTSYFTISQSITRLSTLLRTSTSSFTITQSISRIRTVISSATSYFNISQLTSRISYIYKSVMQSLITENLLGVLKGSYNEISITSSITLSQSLTRIANLYKTFSTSISINAMLLRVRTVSQALTSWFSTSAIVSNLSLFSRISTGYFTMSQYTSRILTNYNYLLQSLSISQSLLKISSIYKTISQSLSVLQISLRLSSMNKVVVDMISINLMEARFIILSRDMATSLSFSSSIQRATFLTRTITETLSIGAVFSRTSYVIRIFIQFFGIGGTTYGVRPFLCSLQPIESDCAFTGCYWCTGVCQASTCIPPSLPPSGGGGGGLTPSTVMNVTEEKVAFDVEVNIENEKVVPRDKVYATISLLKYAGPNITTDVNLTYWIENPEGKILSMKEAVVGVETLRKSMYFLTVPENSELGLYKFKIIGKYDNFTTVASATFNVVSELPEVQLIITNISVPSILINVPLNISLSLKNNADKQLNASVTLILPINFEPSNVTKNITIGSLADYALDFEAKSNESGSFTGFIKIEYEGNKVIKDFTIQVYSKYSYYGYVIILLILPITVIILFLVIRRRKQKLGRASKLEMIKNILEKQRVTASKAIPKTTAPEFESKQVLTEKITLESRELETELKEIENNKKIIEEEFKGNLISKESYDELKTIYEKRISELKAEIERKRIG